MQVRADLDKDVMDSGYVSIYGMSCFGDGTGHGSCYVSEVGDALDSLRDEVDWLVWHQVAVNVARAVDPAMSSIWALRGRI